MKYFAFLLLLALATVFSDKAPEGFTNKNVERKIDLTSQFAKHSIKINAVNTAGKSLSTYFLALDDSEVAHLSFLEVRDKSGVVLKTSEGDKGVQENNGNRISYQLYSVSLNKPVDSQGSIDLEVKMVFTHSLEAYPAQVAQMDRQLVRYFGNHYFFSAYPSQSQVTNVKLSSSSIESKSELSPTSVNGDTIKYGPYADVKEFSTSSLMVHFENNSPFLTVTSLVKEIEVSHWGNVAVEETYQVRHDGAKLKGSFSRYDYQRTQGNAPSHVPIFREVLPRGASDAYYRDEVGNISTSHFSVFKDGALLEFSPRFPLFGGWKIGFYLGYNLPASLYLGTAKQDSSLYVLNMTFATSFENAAVDDLTVRVILPEGAKNPEVHVPFSTEKVEQARHFTYLDTEGRTVLIIKKKNVSPDHNQYFQVTYNFASSGMLREPLLLIGAFLAFFTIIIFLSRLEMNIGKPSSPNAGKIDDAILRFKDICDQRLEHHANLDAALKKAIQSKNLQSYTQEKAQIDSILDKLSKSVKKLISEAESLDAQLARRISAVEAKEEQRTVTQNKLHALESAQRSGKKVADPIIIEAEKVADAAAAELESLVEDLVA